MKKELLNTHYTLICKRYGIKNLTGFKTAARRYECKLNRLYELVCSSEKWAERAEKEAAKVEQQARKNLSKYCRYYKLFTKELYINSDPRGYALKLDAKKVGREFMCKVERDWGSYFVIAPDSEN